MRRAGQAAGLRVGDARHDDQNAVRAIRPCFIYLISIEQEILAKTRQMRCLPCLGKIAETALKRGPVGEHRETCRPPRFKGAGEGRWVEIGAAEPSRGAGRYCL